MQQALSVAILNGLITWTQALAVRDKQTTRGALHKETTGETCEASDLTEDSVSSQMRALQSSAHGFNSCFLHIFFSSLLLPCK